MRTPLAVAVLIVVLASQALASDMANGKKVYADKCLKCHGEKGKGDGPEAADLEKKPADYTDKAKMGKFTDEDLKKVTREGKKPMAAFGKKLTAKEIEDVIGYIRTFAK
jgi:mono/diheme cytochrome c family protein